MFAEICYGVALVSRIDQNYRSLLQKSPIKETIFCKRDLSLYRSYEPKPPHNKSRVHHSLTNTPYHICIWTSPGSRSWKNPTTKNHFPTNMAQHQRQGLFCERALQTIKSKTKISTSFLYKHGTAPGSLSWKSPTKKPFPRKKNCTLRMSTREPSMSKEIFWMSDLFPLDTETWIPLQGLALKARDEGDPFPSLGIVQAWEKPFLGYSQRACTLGITNVGTWLL